MKRLVYAFFLLIYCNSGFCQSFERDSVLLSGSIAKHSFNIAKNSYKVAFYNLPKQLLYLYKGIFSEQLKAHCEFEPSCSSFSVAAFEKFGIVKGYFLTADRLTRCGVSFLETPPNLINRNNAKIIDSPSLYYFSH